MTKPRLLAGTGVLVVLIAVTSLFLPLPGTGDSPINAVPAQPSPTPSRHPQASPPPFGPWQPTPTPSSPKPSGPSPRPLQVSKVPVPDLGVPHYETSGTYPQVSGRGLDLAAVNVALSSTAKDAEDAYRKKATGWLRSREGETSFTGVNDSYFHRRMMVANTALVSTMYPTLRLYPGGNDGSGWLSTTVLAPKGRPVTLAAMFGDNWLNVVSQQTRVQVVATQYCQPTGKLDRRWSYDKGLAPKAKNYEYFALTADGVDIGLGHGQIGAAACGSQRITLPWTTLQDYLTGRGHVLAYYAGSSS